MADLTKISDQDLQALIKSKMQGQPKPTSSSGTFVGDALNTIDSSGRLKNAIFSGLRSAGSGKIEGPGNTGDLTEFMAKERFKASLKPQNQVPTEAPEGFVIANGKVVRDPNYVSPEDAELRDLNIQLQKDKLAQKQADAEDERKAAEERNQILRDDAQTNLDTISKVKEGAKFFGVLGDLPSRLAPSSVVPGKYDERAEWEANVNKLLSQKVLDVMTQMKKASKTGATGFGQLSNKELTVLKEASTALKKTLPPEIALRYLNDMEAIHQRVLGSDAPIATEDSRVGTEVEIPAPTFNTPEEADASGLPPGTVVMIGNRRYEIG